MEGHRLSFELIDFGYLGFLLISILGLIGIDQRHKLVLWEAPSSALITIGIGLGFFLAWDLVGIAQGVFFRGNAPHLTGLVLAPELPIEEVFFLILLCYNSLIVHAAFSRRRLR